MQTIITFLLNFYTLSIMLSMVCMALYIFRVKSLLDKLDIFTILQIKQGSKKDTIITIAACLFVPVFNLMFSLAIILMCVIDNETVANTINNIAKEMVEKQEEEEENNE